VLGRHAHLTVIVVGSVAAAHDLDDRIGEPFITSADHRRVHGAQ
jgi:hypothetical protein